MSSGLMDDRCVFVGGGVNFLCPRASCVGGLVFVTGMDRPVPCMLVLSCF